MEIWKDIPGFEGLYQASNTGKIKSLSRRVWNHQCFMVRKEYIIKDHLLPDGYIQIGLTKPNEKQTRYYIHRLIALAWIPNPNNKPFVNHLDGNKSNNSIENLEWCTKSENVKHAYRTGLMSNKGARHPGAKLSEEDVNRIRVRYSLGESTYRIFNSGDYPVSYTNIKDIIAKRTWSHI